MIGHEELATLRNLRDYILENIPSYFRYESFSVYLEIEPETALERIKFRGREQEKNMSILDLRKMHMKHKIWFSLDVWPIRGKSGQYKESKYGAYIVNSECSKTTINSLFHFVTHFCVDPKLSNVTETVRIANTDDNSFTFGDYSANSDSDDEKFY